MPSGVAIWSLPARGVVGVLRCTERTCPPTCDLGAGHALLCIVLWCVFRPDFSDGARGVETESIHTSLETAIRCYLMADVRAGPRGDVKLSAIRADCSGEAMGEANELPLRRSGLMPGLMCTWLSARSRSALRSRSSPKFAVSSADARAGSRGAAAPPRGVNKVA